MDTFPGTFFEHNLYIWLCELIIMFFIQGTWLSLIFSFTLLDHILLLAHTQTEQSALSRHGNCCQSGLHSRII